MTPQERADLAAGYKEKGMCNCCQAVLKAYADVVPVDEASLMQMGAGYAVGMGCMEATCGSLIGAGMVAGLKTQGKGSVRFSKEILAKFNEKCGATICKDLKGIETGKVLCECTECVRNAVLAAEEVLPTN